MASIANIPVVQDLDQPTVDERRALIQRIAASDHFRKSARLRDFLLYVGLQYLKNGRQDIHEQEIGIKVFGRDASYDPSQDNIVRVTATELRKRIELYFASEGIDESLFLEIPRGAYRPVFRRRLPETRDLPSPPVSTLAEPPVPISFARPSANASRWRVHVVWAMVAMALGTLCVVLSAHIRTIQKTLDPGVGKPALASFWKDFVHANRDTDIVLPDASASLSEEILGQPISLDDYAIHNYTRQLETLQVSPDRRQDLDRIFDHNLVTFGDFHAAQLILALTSLPSSLHLTLSRFYGADSIKRDNLILIGGKKANPWVRLFDDQMNFSLDYDSSHSQLVIANRHPLAGEQAVYVRPAHLSPSDPNSFSGYSVIAFLPNPSRNGNIIIIEGTDSDATSGAAEFLTSEEQLETFTKMIHAKKLPYFEVVLKTSRLSGTSFASRIVAYRAYPDLH
jgi:hypothetical protein